MTKFIEYVRWRSWGLVSLLIYLAIRHNDLGLIVLLIVFLIHTYYIFKNDKGVTHSDLNKEIKSLQRDKCNDLIDKREYHKANLANQATIIKLLENL